MSPSLCAFGLDASTGAYLLDPPPAQEVADAAVREQADPDHLREMQHKAEAAANPSYAPVAGLDPLELGEVGWGVVFAPDVGPEVRDALRPLLDLRRQQAGALFRDFPAEKAYRPTDSYLDFLGRSGAGPGPADPEKVPYYLLLVGGPESIPFEFQ